MLHRLFPGVLLNLFLLKVFFVRIALRAGVSVSMRRDAAFVLAFFSFGCRLLTAGLLSREGRAGQESDRTDADHQGSNGSHVFLLENFGCLVSVSVLRERDDHRSPQQRD